MRCKNVLTRVDALRTGELEPSDRREVRDHLKKCRSCDASMSDVELLASAAKSLVAAPPRTLREACCDQVDRIDDVWVAFSPRGLRMIHRGGTQQEFTRRYAQRYGRPIESGPLPAALRKQVSEALRGEGVAKPQLDLAGASELEMKVMQTLAGIPRGEVRTYSWLAEHVGKPRAVRAIASFVARNSVPFVVPCHRVVPAAGGVGKYAFGTAAKRDMLRREGVDVDALDALAREGVRYVGSKTTNIVCFPTCKDARRIREENRVPFHAAGEAIEKGFRPCRRCQPFAVRIAS
jgi:O-6-methylguanine DNA methyltransferase